MAFKGTESGGEEDAAEPPPGLGVVGLDLALSGATEVATALEKQLRWKELFFSGSCVVCLAGTAAAMHWLTSLCWAPATFLVDLFLIGLGVIMMVIDYPAEYPRPEMATIRDSSHKFALFITRFTGRGFLYLFLATMVFAALWDTHISSFFGGFCTAYLMILGTSALLKGWTLSTRLQSVRELIVSSGRGADQLMAAGQEGLSTEQFQKMVESVTDEQEFFSLTDLDYVINALSFLPDSKGQVTLEECEYWLGPGPMLVV